MTHLIPILSGPVEPLSLTAELLITIALIHFLLGAGLLYGVYWLVEYRLRLALLFGFAVVGVVALVEGSIAPVLLEFTNAEQRLSIQVGVISAIIGAIIVGIVFEPDIDHQIKFSESE